MTKEEILDGLERLAQVMDKAEFREWGRFCRDTAQAVKKHINASETDPQEAARRIYAAARDEIADEIADVEIMLAQMKLLHDCEADVDIHRQMKLDRLKDRLNKVRDPEARLE